MQDVSKLQIYLILLLNAPVMQGVERVTTETGRFGQQGQIMEDMKDIAAGLRCFAQIAEQGLNLSGS